MRGLVEEMKGAIGWFAQEQREHFAMVLAYEEGDAPLVAQCLHGMDQADPDVCFLTFLHEARTERAYVDVMLELMGTRREVVNAEREGRGLPLVPEPPETCADFRRPAAERIRALLAWWRASLLEPDQPVVLSLLPMKLDDPGVYERIVWDLLPARELAPWTRFTRVMLRDSRDTPFLEPRLHREPREATVAYSVDFSPKACEEGLAFDAGNPELTPKARGTAMLQLAALDFAHQRYPQALEKYGRLANLFADLGEEGLVALCLSGAGDVHRRAGQLKEARQRYAKGAEVATKVEAKPVMLNCLMGLGGACQELGEYQQAEAAWDAAARVAGSLNNPYGICDCVEQVGVARLSQGRTHEAVHIWEKALELIRDNPYAFRATAILERMVALAAQQGWSDHERAWGERLAVARHEKELQGGVS